jgi:hypothetical protein
MTIAAIDNAYQSINTLTSELIAIPKTQKKSISAIIDVIELTTNVNSVSESKKLLKELVDIQDSLPVSEEGLDVVRCRTHLNFANEHLTEINTFLDFVKFLFDYADTSHAKVDIDNDNMMAFLVNMKKAQQVLEYISNYLTLVLKTEKFKAEEPKEYTAESLIEFIAA